jgi:MFS transporter, OPA family, glycerol-3-phosphate transporter
MTPSDPPAERPDPPRVAALPGNAPPVDHESLAHIHFPPGFRARRGINWMSIGLLYTSFYMCRYNLPLVNKAICDQYHFTNAKFGIIITASALAYACGQIINGLLTDRMGGKRAMLIGAAGTVTMNALFGAASYAGILGLFVAIWGINGYVQSFGAPGMVKMNAAWFARRERGTFAGIFGFMINLGRLIIGQVGPMLLAGFTIIGVLHVAPLHWRWLFWVPSVCCAIVAIFMALIVAETPEQAGYDYVGSRDSHDDATTQADVMQILKTILPNPAIWVTAGAYACTGAVRQSVDYWFPKYMQVVHNLNLNSGKFYLLVFLIPLVASCGSLMSGVISDRLFQSRRAPVAAALYLIETAIILAAAQFHSPNTAILFFVLISFTANSTHSLLGTAAAMDIGGRKMTGFASGMIDSFQYFGGSLAGYALGATIDKFGWGSYFYFMAPFGVIGGVLMITLGHRITAAQYGAGKSIPRGFEVVTPDDVEPA